MFNFGWQSLCSFTATCSETLLQATTPPVFAYSEQNYTAILNESSSLSSIIFINVTYHQPDVLVSWKHNNSILDIGNSLKWSVPARGGLQIHQVQLSDAGRYTLTVSTGAQCQSAEFTLVVECKYVM